MPGRCACTVQFTEKTLQKRLTKGGAAGIITHVAGSQGSGGLAQLGARLVSKRTPSQIVLRQSNSQQKTPSKRFASWILWGISSAGRALAWHARGQRFDPAILHQKSTVLRLKYGAFLFAFLEVALKIIQMPDFAGTWTATPNSCCFVVSENACSMPDCFAGGRITPPQCKE